MSAPTRRTKRLLAGAALVAATVASACGSGHDLVVDIEPGCTAQTATLVRIDVTLAPTGSQRVELQAASFFAPTSSHTVVVIPRDGTTGIDVDVTVFDAASKLVGSGHSHTDVSGPGEDHATILFGDCHGTDGGVVPDDGPVVVHDAGPGDMACPSGYTRCGAACVDLTTDVQHCGGCSNACDLDHFCQSSACVANCTGGTMLCGMSCVDINTNNANCGGCNMPCGPTVTHGTASCSFGGCSIDKCDVGWDDCDFVASNGCEQSLADAKNCGSCGNDCSMLPNVASTSCSAMACVVSGCKPGWNDCNKKPDDGCESNPMTDASNCGACGTACGVGGGCVSGKCVTPATFATLSSPTTVDLEAAWGSGASNVYLVGGALSVLRSTDGLTFTVVRSSSSMSSYHFNAVYGSTSSDVWAAGDAGQLYHFDGASWTSVSSGTTTTLDGVWTDGPGNVFLAGFNLVAKGGLSGFTPQATGISNEWVFGVWGITGGGVHAVADGSNFANYVGGSWSLVNDHANLYAVWGSSAMDIWLVGQQGQIEHSSDGGVTFSAQSSGVTVDLKGVWGSGPGDLYAVGLGGTLLHSFGDGTWTKIPSGTSAALSGVWGTGPKNVYVVGQAGTILHGT